LLEESVLQSLFARKLLATVL